MLLDLVKKGSVDRSVILRIIDSTDGTPETGVVFNTSGIDLWYRREGAAKTSITEATLSALTDAHADGGFLHIGDGYYRLDLPDAAFATGANHVDIGGTVTGMVVIGGRVRLVNYDPEDAVRFGLTALPNAAAEAAGGLYTRGSGAGQINQDANGRVDTRWVSGNVTVGTNSDKTGYALSSAGVQAIWDALTSALTTVGSIGKLLVDNINATISSRSSHAAADVWAVATRVLTAGTNIVLAKGTGVTGFNDLSAAQVNAEADTALADYDAPTRAELTSDTNSILSKLLKYVQLILRKDAAIATDNSTEVTAINADGGSGAGAFANATDSQEALRDRGDAAWVTATGFSTLDAAGVRTAVGLASANLDTQLAALPTAGENADAVWEEPITDHSGTSGSTAEALGAAGAAGDPWSTQLPGAYGAGSAGKIVGDNIDATVSSRSSHAAADVWAVGARTLTAFSFAVDISAAAVSLVWDKATSALTTVGSIGKLLVDRLDAAISSRSSHSAADVWAAGTRTLTSAANITSTGGTTVPQTGDAYAVVNSGTHGNAALKTLIDAVDAVVDAIQAKTDNLPSDPADQSLIIAATNALGSAISALNNLSVAQVKAQADQALADVGLTSARATKLDALPARLRKNTAFANFQFLMVDEADHLTGMAGLTVTAQRVLDDGAIAACTNNPEEIGSGLYRLDLAAADLNGDIVTLLFTAPGADARVITAILQEAA